MHSAGNAGKIHYLLVLSELSDLYCLLRKKSVVLSEIEQI